MFLQTRIFENKTIEEVNEAIKNDEIGTLNFILEKYFNIDYGNEVTTGIKKIFETVGFTNATSTAIAGYGTYLIMVFMIDILIDLLLFIPKETKKIFKKVVKENE